MKNSYSLGGRRSITVFGVLLSMCALVSCEGGVNGKLSSESSRPDVAQEGREKVHVDFVSDEERATNEYKNRWRNRNRAASSVVEQVEMLAIAGELMRRDRNAYDGYYNYVFEHLGSDSPEVVGSALAALSNARGVASIEILTLYASNRRPVIALEALDAIAYRYQTSRFDPSLSDDLRAIRSFSIRACAQSDRSELMEKYCERNNFGG